MNEVTRWIIDVSFDTGWFGCLLFTSDRIVVARTEQKRCETDGGRLMEFISRRIDIKVRREGEQRRLSYMTMHPDNILAADTKNVAIPYSEIEKVEMKEPGRIWAGRITISTTKRERPYKYPLREGKEVFSRHVSLVLSFLPDRLIVT